MCVTNCHSVSVTVNMNMQKAFVSTIVNKIINKYDHLKFLEWFDLTAFLGHVVKKVYLQTLNTTD